MCCALGENGSHGLMYLNGWSQVGATVLGRIRCAFGRYDFIEGGMSLGMGFEVSKALAPPYLPA